MIVLPAIEAWMPHTDGNGKLTEAVPCEVTNAMPSLKCCLCSEEASLFKDTIQYMQHGQNNLINKVEVLHPCLKKGLNGSQGME